MDDKLLNDSNWSSNSSGDPLFGSPKKKDISPAIAVIFMIAITVVIMGILYVWVTSLADTSATMALDEAIGPQKVPAEPISLDINIFIEIKYVYVQGEYITLYDINYNALFTFESKAEISEATLPLPKGSINDLQITLNNKLITKPNYKNNKITLDLPSFQRNTVRISYSAFGTDKYSHSLPTDRLIEQFKLKIVVDSEDFTPRDDVPKDCLMPDEITRKGDKTTLEWERTNAVLRQDITIMMPAKDNHFDNYLALLPILVILIICMVLFYLEGFKRTGKKWKWENIIFIAGPVILLYMVLGLLLVYLFTLLSILISFVFVMAILLFVNKKVLNVRKGLLEMYFIPCLGIGATLVFVFYWNIFGIVVGMSITIATFLFVLNFLRKYKRPAKKEPEVDLIKKINELNEEKEKISTKLNLENSEMNQKILDLSRLNNTLRKKRQFMKRFCVFCGYKISSDFGFCPHCGKDISIVRRCTSCKNILSGNENYCPNCREVMESIEEPTPVSNPRATV